MMGKSMMLQAGPSPCATRLARTVGVFQTLLELNLDEHSGATMLQREDVAAGSS